MGSKCRQYAPLGLNRNHLISCDISSKDSYQLRDTSIKRRQLLSYSTATLRIGTSACLIRSFRFPTTPEIIDKKIPPDLALKMTFKWAGGLDVRFLKLMNK